ncbi:MAG: helix-turn-helix domain-containing protein [bacterium]|nr:helix-turn-helix domain-containing protein [bacterium]
MTIGQILRSAREEMGFSEKEAADDLQIPLKFIISLERGEWSKLPARVYARGFLKKYADYLELKSEEIVKEFDKELADVASSEVLVGIPEQESGGRWLLFLNQQKVVLIIFCAAIIFAGAYFFYEFRFVIRPPELTITSPAKDEVTAGDSFPISGVIEKESTLTLNGRTVYTNAAGEFSDSALLSKGLNSLEFEVKNRFGKTNKVLRYILVK